MEWSLLADAVVVFHLAFVSFVILGGFLTWRWPAAAFAHIPALAWGIWVEMSAQICPLTPLENRLRHWGGEAGYSGGFIEHYIVPVLYPPRLTRTIQWSLAVSLIALNVVAYGVLLARRHSMTGGNTPQN